MKDFPISELRKVSTYFFGSEHPSEKMMHVSQVETYIKAQIELHYERKTNPHVDRWNATHPNDRLRSTGETSRARIINVSAFFDKAGPYWWTTPGMEDNGTGAEVLLGWNEKRHWAHPDILAEEQRIMNEDENWSPRYLRPGDAVKDS